ncbi:collagen alpha-1(XII) chain [Biomphalaria glabrata]|uniref:Uncharacterized protein n=1 Tax=Biomphalaria glabrata TaxID=6526 RepID=A0A2C9KSW0_BIOGL|nr:collagen alpha-1(XII) chain [Biomphalaria glabrata]
MKTTSLIVFTVAVIYGVSAIECPRCTNPNDWNSCSATHACNGPDDTCQLVIENDGTKHKINYHCIHRQNCQQHATTYCDITVHGHCSMCCDTIDSCKILLDTVFEAGVSVTTCPKCTNVNDWMSCTNTQICHGSEDGCQLVVDNDGIRHKVNYHCIHRQNCQQHETQHCDISVHGHCNFCCDTADACRVQIEGIFDPSA